MTGIGWLQILVFFAAIVAVTKPLGVYMFRVFEGERAPLPRVLGGFERLLYRLSGVDPKREQTWKQYAFALLAFSAIGVLVTYFLQRTQQVLPFNPQHFGAVEPGSAFNTAASFTTNTNWQGYSGESTMSYLSQMAGLAWHNFTSAAAGICVALALGRGFARRPGPTGRRRWATSTSTSSAASSTCSCRSASCSAWSSCGRAASRICRRTWTSRRSRAASRRSRSVRWHRRRRSSSSGPTAAGFFNANAAHPFENPTPFTNFLSLFMIFAVSSGLTYTYGRMARDQKHGWAIWGAMSILFIAGVVVCYGAEAHGNPALAGLQVDQSIGNMEGKEVRFGVSASALYATVTTDASCGAVNAMHDSFTPLGGLVPLGQHPAGRGGLRRHGRGPLRDVDLRGAHGVHRRPDGRTNARVSRARRSRRAR